MRSGYLRTLVDVCRTCCARLPSYECVRPLVVEEARRAQVLAINHDLDPAARDATLRAWVSRELPAEQEARWFELTGAASASLTVHVLLALGAEAACSQGDLARAQRAYFPWISAATTMLDSYVDQLEDAANGDHSYVAHYSPPAPAPTRSPAPLRSDSFSRSRSRSDSFSRPAPAPIVERIRWLLARSFREAGALGDPELHVLIVACMVAMYLSKDSARSEELRAGTASLVRAGGSLTRVLLPILRLWRILYAQRST